MSNQIVISSGAKVRNLSGVLTGTSGVVNSLGINVPDGIPQLDGSGKILVSQLPNSVMEYKGTWNASTNTPTLANGTGNAGDVYLCNVAGTVNFGAGPITFAVGDQVLYSGTTWERASGATGTVTSVAVTESGDALTITGSPITTSGTINIGFAGTSGQYINGAGGLTTFPSLTGYVPYTGATANVDLGNYGLLADYLNVNVPSTHTPTVGDIVWNSTDGTFDMGLLNGVTLQAGQELHFYGKASGAIGNGKAVMFAGAEGDHLLMAEADAATINANPQYFIGVATQDFANNDFGYVTVLGKVRGLNTSAYTSGQVLYYDSTSATDGLLTTTMPTAPNAKIEVAAVVRVHATQGVLMVRPHIMPKMSLLQDVNISSIADNQLLAWSTNRFENKSISTILGYTPANDSLVVHLAGTETITGAKTFSSAIKSEVSLTSKSIGTTETLAPSGYVNIQTGGFSGYMTLALSNDTATRNLEFPISGGGKISYELPSTSGIIALTSDIPSLSGYVQGSGTTNYVPKFTGSGTIGNSTIIDNTSYVKISTDLEVHAPSGSGALMTIASNGFDEVSFRAVNSSGGNKNLLYFGSTISFYTGTLDVNSGTERMTITPTGNVGIGNISPSYKLDVNGTGNFAGALSGTSATFSSSVNIGGTGAAKLGVYGAVPANTYLLIDNAGSGINYYAANNYHEWQTAGSTRMILTSSGNVGIGTSSPSRLLNISGGGTDGTQLQINGTVDSAGIKFVPVSGDNWEIQANTSNQWFVYNRTDSAYRFLIDGSGNVGIGNGATYAPYLLTLNVTGGGQIIGGIDNSNGASLGYIQFNAGSMLLNARGSSDTNHMQFNTGGSERMRINSSGNVLIGTTTDNAYKLNVNGTIYCSQIMSFGTTTEMYIGRGNGITGALQSYDFAMMNFQSGGRTFISNATTGVYLANGSTSWSTFSDERLKNINGIIDNAVGKLSKIRAVNYSWKSDKTNKQVLGLIAQDVENEFPQVIDKSKTLNEYDQNEYLSVRYTELIPVLIKAIQEQQAQIEELKAKIK